MIGLGVVIQAGGLGTRLGGVFDGPKALAPLADGTLIDHLLDRVAALEPERIVVLAHHRADEVAAAVADRAEVIVEEAPLGTAGGLALLPEGPSRWIVLNVDHVSDLDLAALAARPRDTAVVQPFELLVDEGVIDVVDGRVAGVRERPRLALHRSIGAYRFDAATLGALPPERLDMPELLARLAEGGLDVFVHDGTWFDAGTPERLAAADVWVRANRTRG